MYSVIGCCGSVLCLGERFFENSVWRFCVWCFSFWGTTKYGVGLKWLCKFVVEGFS